MSGPWQPYQQAEGALRTVEQGLAAAPADPMLLFERARLLDRLGRGDLARQAYIDVLARDFRHEGALLGLGALLFAQRFTSAARTSFEQAVAINPANLEARVRLGDLLRLAEQGEPARAEYEAALAIDPACPAAHQGLSYLLDETDPAQAAEHRRLGFAGSGVVTAAYRGSGVPVRVLRIVSALGGNVPLDEVLDDRRFLVHTVVAEFAGPDLALPAHDVVFNAVGDAGRCAETLRGMPALLSRTSAPVINNPERVLRTARDSTQLSAAGAVVPACVEMTRATIEAGALPGFGFPLLLRSPGFHTGQHFRQVQNATELRDALPALPGETLYAMQYVDTRSADGRFRKYRVMLIGGELLPLHLAASSQWKVHYFTADMATDAALRREEAAFLEDMPGVLGPAAMTALRAIPAILRLDYAGVDCGLTADGRLVVFEANATMTIVSPTEDPIWDYRRAAIRRAIEAAQALIGVRAA